MHGVGFQSLEWEKMNKRRYGMLFMEQITAAVIRWLLLAADRVGQRIFKSPLNSWKVEIWLEQLPLITFFFWILLHFILWMLRCWSAHEFQSTSIWTSNSDVKNAVQWTTESDVIRHQMLLITPKPQRAFVSFDKYFDFTKDSKAVQVPARRPITAERSCSPLDWWATVGATACLPLPYRFKSVCMLIPHNLLIIKSSN